MHSEIAASTAGVIFLGTPHRGCGFATWGKIITSLASPLIHCEDRILKSLEDQSDVLVQRLHEFSRWLFSESVPVVCCFEKFHTDYSRRVGMGKSGIISTLVRLIQLALGII